MRRPRAWEAVLLVVLLGILVAEIGALTGGLGPSAAEPIATNPPAIGSTPAAPGSQAPTVADPPYARLVGQKLMVAMDGTTLSPALLGRIERGEIGGVILFGFNIVDAGQLRALTQQLQAAAIAGGQPPLLIASDQEGGGVKRLTWAPPALTPPAMGELGDTATVHEQGLETGYVLRCAGINNDLAPVADVPSSTSSFMYLGGRTWSFDAAATATLADAFASGLQAGGDVPAMKHFPGLGYAADNTDEEVVTIGASRAALAPGLLPYQAAIGHGIPMIMLSNATYPAYDAENAAGWSHAIGVDLLRTTLGFRGVTITDSLNGTAKARGVSTTSLARKAAAAGTDMILLTGSEERSASAYTRLLEDAEAGAIPLAMLQDSYDRILALKATVDGPVADTDPPAVVAPSSRLYAPATLASRSVPVRTSWSAAADPCAVSGFALERRADDAAWAGQGLGSPTDTSIRQPLPAGSTYRYRVDATDGAGNRSEPVRGALFEPAIVQALPTSVTFSGPWATGRGKEFSGGTVRYASVEGASATYTFTGTSVGWVAALGPTRGSADVYVDRELRQTVDLYAAARKTKRIVFVASWHREGSHVIEIVVAGKVGHPRVDVDAFVSLVQP